MSLPRSRSAALPRVHATDESRQARLADDLCIHIFTVSAGMVGVCLTVIGLIRIITIRKVDTFADDLLAVNAVLFLVACLTAYTALRTRTANAWRASNTPRTRSSCWR